MGFFGIYIGKIGLLRKYRINLFFLLFKIILA